MDFEDSDAEITQKSSFLEKVTSAFWDLDFL